jgi:hypothetical protein
VDRAELSDWVSGYERAWRTPGTEALAELFAAGASYRMGPYEPAAEGLDEKGLLAGPEGRLAQDD